MHTGTNNGTKREGNTLGLFLVGALLFMAPAARANTYMFSVTGGEILSAMTATTDFPSNVTSSGYFAVFLQPTGITSFTYAAETAPSTSSALTAWEASTITDYANLGEGEWARFSKQQNQSQVALLSNADPGSGNIWMNYTHMDNGSGPISWGGTLGQIVEVFSAATQFQLRINTNETLSGPYYLLGNATSIFSSSPLTVVSPKTEPNINFLIEATPTYEGNAVPEPSTWVFTLAGLVVVLAARHSVRKPQPVKD